MLARAAALSTITESGRNNFGLLRLAAAACVVVSHAFYIATGDGSAQPLTGLTRYNLGQHAVHVFFVLSGLLVAGSLDRTPSLAAFVLARALRIVPGLAVCVLVTAFLLGPLVSKLSLLDYFGSAQIYAYPLQTITLIKISGLLPGVFEANPAPGTVNEPLWTLKYEALCYALLTLLAVARFWRSRAAFLAVLVLSLVACLPLALQPPLPTGVTSVAGSVARFWLCFLLGLTFYRYRAGVPLSWPLLATLAGLWWVGVGTKVEPVLTFILAGYGAIMLASCPAGAVRRWTTRHDLSYGVYIYGWPISQSLVWALPGISAGALAAASLLTASAVGWISWTYAEQPCLRARGRLTHWIDQHSTRRGAEVEREAVAS